MEPDLTPIAIGQMLLAAGAGIWFGAVIGHMRGYRKARLFYAEPLPLDVDLDVDSPTMEIK